MPGIAGIIRRQPTGDETKELNAMLTCMMHEPTYSCGTHTDHELGFHAVYVAIKGSFADCMPVHNETRDLVMLFSGECFTDQELVNQLKNRGHEFKTGDASYLVHLYEEQGERFFEELNGWFSGVILDRRKRSAMLFNDRYGLERVYYHENKDSFFFSSEAKALLKLSPLLRTMDLEGLGEYLAFDCVLENRTLFAGVSLLPGGSLWRFSNGRVKKDRYFSPGSWESQPTLDRTTLFRELTGTFRRILLRYLSGESVGLSLTGGQDTRMILACANPAAMTLPCYTFGGLYRDSLDVRLARRVAEASHQTHQVLRVDREFLSQFPSHAERTVFLSDGLANVCESEVIHLNKLAREIAPIRLTGKFGTQVLRGFSALLRAHSPHEQLFNQDVNTHISVARERFDTMAEEGLSFVLFKENPWRWAGSTVAESSQLTVRSPYMDNEFVRLLYQAPKGVLPGFQLRCIAESSPKLFSIPTNRGACGSTSPLVSKPRQLAFQLINAVDKVYDRDRLPYSLHHWVARLDHALSPLHLEELVIGFCHYRHYRLWFRRELSQYVEEMLLDNRTLNRPYWNRRLLTKIVLDHTSGRGNYLAEIKKTLTLELIQRLLLEGI